METHEIPHVTLNDGTTIPQLGFGTLNVQPDRSATPANVARTAEIVGLASHWATVMSIPRRATGANGVSGGRSRRPGSRAPSCT